VARPGVPCDEASSRLRSTPPERRGHRREHATATSPTRPTKNPPGKKSSDSPPRRGLTIASGPAILEMRGTCKRRTRSVRRSRGPLAAPVDLPRRRTSRSNTSATVCPDHWPHHHDLSHRLGRHLERLHGTGATPGTTGDTGVPGSALLDTPTARVGEHGRAVRAHNITTALVRKVPRRPRRQLAVMPLCARVARRWCCCRHP